MTKNSPPTKSASHLPFLKSYRLTEQSTEPVKISWSVTLTEDIQSLASFKVWKGPWARDRRSQHIRVLSRLPEMATEDSSLNLTQVTVAACPLNRLSGCPVDTSHTKFIVTQRQRHFHTKTLTNNWLVWRAWYYLTAIARTASIQHFIAMATISFKQ